MVKITAQALRCMATTQDGSQCKFKGLHMSGNERFCGNHLVWLGKAKVNPAQASLPFSAAEEALKVFGPTKNSVEIAEGIIAMVNGASKQPSVIVAYVAYMLDGYVANVVRRQAAKA